MNIVSEDVVILDYGSGNLFSVQQACKFVGLNPIITNDKKMISRAKAIILPGVGAFGDAMMSLNKLDLVGPIKDFIASEKPFLGVCLGMQLLFESSEEFGSSNGLGIIKGVIKKIPKEFNNKKVSVPQIAWNRIFRPINVEWNETPLHEIKNGEFMYFVHSYYAQPENQKNVLTFTSYEGFEYTSSVRQNNVFAFQFHPEKSGVKGLEIYRNFYNLFLLKNGTQKHTI